MYVEIAGVDITSNLIIGQYKVNRSDVYESWTDANGRTHRNVYRTRVSGSFDVFFRKLEDYTAFVNAYEAARNPAGVVPCKLFVNNSSENADVDAYISFAPVLSVDGTMQDMVQQFEITVEEY